MKTRGNLRRPPRPLFDVTICDIKDSNSSVRELKGKVVRKAVSVPLDLLVESRRRNAVQFGQVAVEHHLFAANQVDMAGDALDRDNGLGLSHW